MKIKRITASLAVLLAVAVLSAGVSVAAPVDNLGGKVSQNSYTNSYFNFNFTPSGKGWILTSPGSNADMITGMETDQLKTLEKKKAAVAPSDKKKINEIKKQIKSLKDSINKAKSLKKSLNNQNRILVEGVNRTGSDFLVLSVRCQKVLEDTPLKDAKSYLSYMARPAGKNSPRYPIKTALVGGKTFHYVQVPLAGAGKGKLKNSVTRTYCRVVKGYFLVINCTYPAGGQAQAQKALGYIHF